MGNNLHYFHPSWIESSTELLSVDICVYGGTAAGVVAAVTAARAGRSTLLLHPGRHIGGMTSGGLSNTDIGNKFAIGGLARQFYRDLGAHYGWKESWRFEPHVAEKLLLAWLRDSGLTIRWSAFLDQVDLDGDRIGQITLRGGLRVKARVFIDATYEGDLMAGANVPYAVGREDNSTYGESFNGAQINPTHQFDKPVDPYRVPGRPDSGLLPRINDAPPPPIGSGDHRIQAYNFRLCMTSDYTRIVSFPRPSDYRADEYILAARWLATTADSIFTKFDLIAPDKTDTNNHGAVSTDYIGANYGWPDGTFEAREVIFQDHVRYQQGLHWFMANSPDVPDRIRHRYAQWGLAGDEFVDTDHWPHQLYVREARRMIADYVVTDRDCLGHRRCDDPVGMGAYSMDSHNCQRCLRDGAVINEGDIQRPLDQPYPISWRAIVPGDNACDNLLVPVCVSASHIAFGSIRMEPVFMILAQSAAIAADLAIAADSRCQDVPYASLRERLEAAGQILACDSTNHDSPGNAV